MHGVDDAGEFGEQPVSAGLDHPTAMFGNAGLDQFLEVGGEGGEGAFLVVAISRENPATSAARMAARRRSKGSLAITIQLQLHGFRARLYGVLYPVSMRG